MKQNRIAFIIIILLVLSNLGTLAFCFWFSPHSAKEGRRFRSQEGIMEGRRKELTQFLDKQLNLSDQQSETMEALRKDFFTRSSKIRREIRAARREFYGLTSEDVDEVVFKKQADSVAQKQKMLEMATFIHFQSLRKILNREQQPKFDSIVQDMLEGRRNKNRKRQTKDEK